MPWFSWLPVSDFDMFQMDKSLSEDIVFRLSAFAFEGLRPGAFELLASQTVVWAINGNDLLRASFT